jgi:hypothetical protein
MGAHKAMEHAEHTAHGGGHGHHGGGNKSIGVTMAIMGALIAFCAAMVGAERNELTRTMMEQTQAYTNYTAATTKFRLIMLELEKQRGKLAVLKASEAPAAANAMDMKVVQKFLVLSTHYSMERKISKGWSESFHPLVEVHFMAAEDYERAQMIAEFGIVLASLAVLLGNRPIWMVSMVLAVACVGQLGYTSLKTRRAVAHGVEEVHHVEQDYERLRTHLAAMNEDEQTLEELDPGGAIRQAFQKSIEHAAVPAPAHGAAEAGGHH